MTQLDNITKKQLLPVITIAKTSGVYTYNPFTSVFDFRLISCSIRPPFDSVGGIFDIEISGGTGINSEMNTILSNISEGNEVTFWVGKTDASKTKIFLGIIETIIIDENNKNYMSVKISGPDWGSDLLKNRVVSFQFDQSTTDTGAVDNTDDSTTITNLITKILSDTQSYPTGAADGITPVSQGLVVSAANILPIDIQIPTFSARFEYLDDKLQELDDYSLSYHYVDPDKNFIVKQLNTSTEQVTVLFTDDVNDSILWVSGNVGLIAPNSSFKRTLEHHKRRVFGLGGLSSSVDQSNTTTTLNTELASNYIAQRFTPSKTTLSKINLWLSVIGTPTADFIMELRDDYNNLPVGEILRSVSKNKNILTTGTATIVTFEINEELTPGRNYWIVCMKNGSDVSNCFRWHRDALDTGVSAISTDDVSWNLTSTPNRFNYAFQAFLGNELISTSQDPNLTATSKHFHEYVIRKPEIINDHAIRILLTQEDKTLHKKKEVMTCSVFAPDTLLHTGQKVRVRKQQSGYLVDGEFTLGQIEYIFESNDEGVMGSMYYNVELARFVDYN